MLLSQRITSVAAALFTDLLGNGRDGWGKRLTAHKNAYPIYWIVGLLLCSRHLLMRLYMGHSICTSFTRLERSVHVLLPQMSFSPSFLSSSFQIPDQPANPLATAHESLHNHTSCFFSFQTSCNTMGSAHGEDFLLQSVSFQGCPQKGL